MSRTSSTNQENETPPESRNNTKRRTIRSSQNSPLPLLKQRAVLGSIASRTNLNNDRKRTFSNAFPTVQPDKQRAFTTDRHRSPFGNMNKASASSSTNQQSNIGFSHFLSSNQNTNLSPAPKKLSDNNPQKMLSPFGANSSMSHIAALYSPAAAEAAKQPRMSPYSRTKSFDNSQLLSPSAALNNNTMPIPESHNNGGQQPSASRSSHTLMQHRKALAAHRGVYIFGRRSESASQIVSPAAPQNTVPMITSTQNKICESMPYDCTIKTRLVCTSKHDFQWCNAIPTHCRAKALQKISAIDLAAMSDKEQNYCKFVQSLVWYEYPGTRFEHGTLLNIHKFYLKNSSRIPPLTSLEGVSNITLTDSSGASGSDANTGDVITGGNTGLTSDMAMLTSDADHNFGIRLWQRYRQRVSQWLQAFHSLWLSFIHHQTECFYLQLDTEQIMIFFVWIGDGNAEKTPTIILNNAQGPFQRRLKAHGVSFSTPLLSRRPSQKSLQSSSQPLSSAMDDDETMDDNESKRTEDDDSDDNDDDVDIAQLQANGIRMRKRRNSTFHMDASANGNDDPSVVGSAIDSGVIAIEGDRNCRYFSDFLINYVPKYLTPSKKCKPIPTLYSNIVFTNSCCRQCCIVRNVTGRDAATHNVMSTLEINGVFLPNAFSTLVDVFNTTQMDSYRLSCVIGKPKTGIIAPQHRLNRVVCKCSNKDNKDDISDDQRLFEKSGLGIKIVSKDDSDSNHSYHITMEG